MRLSTSETEAETYLSLRPSWAETLCVLLPSNREKQKPKYKLGNLAKSVGNFVSFALMLSSNLLQAKARLVFF